VHKIYGDKTSIAKNSSRMNLSLKFPIADGRRSKPLVIICHDTFTAAFYDIVHKIYAERNKKDVDVEL
jgi:hypothetical protein